MLRKESKKSKSTKNKKKSINKEASNAICFDRMIVNGICIHPDKQYSASLKFSDVNYQIAKEEEQENIFGNYMEILNALCTESGMQLTINNRIIDEEDFEKEVLYESKMDDYSRSREEWNKYLKSRITEGNHKIVTEKMLTYAIKSENYHEAKKEIRIHNNEVISKFEDLGSNCEIMRGHDRLETIFSIFNPEKKFCFNYDSLKLQKNFKAKDAITPDILDFNYSTSTFQLNDRFAKILYLKNYSTELNDKLINDLSRIEHNITISFHMKAIERGEDISLIKSQIAKMQMQKMDEQKKALKNGYDPDMIPLELQYSLAEAETQLKDVQERNQKLFSCQFFVMINETNTDELKEVEKKVNNVAKRHGTEFGVLHMQQKECLNAILPLAYSELEISRTLTTYAAAIFIPFTSQELMQKGNSFYYGVNPMTGNLILADRTRLKAPTGFVLATPGSGKSFKVKQELNQVMIGTNDDYVAIDPEREYKPLAEELKGSIVTLGAKNGIYFNPWDFDDEQLNYAATKADFGQVLMAQIMGEKLSSTQVSIVDRCVRRMYTDYEIKISNRTNVIKVEKPTMDDFYDILIAQPEIEAKTMAIALEIYVKDGTYNMFSKQSNVDVNNRFTVYDMLDLGEGLKPLAMLITLETLWQRILFNFRRGVRTWITIDEIYLLFANEYCTEFLYKLFKRARKYGAIITGITQNVEDLLRNDRVRTMLSNSDFIIMLNQATSDREELASLLNISKQQLSYVTNARAGHGLLFNGNAIIPFEDNFPENSYLYGLYNTDFNKRTRVYS